MKELPILFSAPMVRAILDGTKTQTRRIVKLTDSGRVKAVGSANNWHLEDPNAVLACPYGKPGDRLWVRETWAEVTGPVAGETAEEFGRKGIIYRSDEGNDSSLLKGIWKPSIFCKREHSRITLEITGIRVESLQDISPEDCIAEGITVKKGSGMIEGEDCYMMTTNSGYMRGPRGAIRAYQDLWESINSPGSWDANPFVWVITFNRIQP